MIPSHPFRFLNLAILNFLLVSAAIPSLEAQAAYVRVNQIGYEAGKTPFRAFLMSTASANTAALDLLTDGTVYRRIRDKSPGCCKRDQRTRCPLVIRAGWRSLHTSERIAGLGHSVDAAGPVR
jgi:hypothetical protein